MVLNKNYFLMNFFFGEKKRFQIGKVLESVWKVFGTKLIMDQ
jgi:hypothetical protein